MPARARCFLLGKYSDSQRRLVNFCMAQIALRQFPFFLLIAVWFLQSCSDSGSERTEGGQKETGTERAKNLQVDWPIFRGDSALSGVARGALPDRLGLRWRFQSVQPIRSSPVIKDDRVYIGGNDSKLYAIDLNTGTEIWSYQTQDAIEAAPCVVDDMVYVGSSDGYVYAIHTNDGSLAWQYETGDKILGAVNWTPAPDGASKWVLVGSYDSKLHCIDSQTGQSIWTYTTESYINGAPAVLDGKIVVGGCDAHVHVVSVADGQALAQIDAGAYIAGSIAMDGTLAYVGHYGNEFLCVDLNLNEVRWRYADRKFPYFSSAAIGPVQVVFGGRDKRLHCIDRGTGQPIWTFATRGKVDSSPVICGDRVVVGSEDGNLYLVSLAEGKELWSYPIGEAITSSPAIARETIVIGADDGSVYAFGQLSE